MSKAIPMGRKFTLWIFLFSCTIVYGQQGETMKQNQPNFYNSSQSPAILQEIEQDPNNAKAWGDLYKAERLSNYNNYEKTLSKEANANLDRIVHDMERNVPNSSELNYALYQQSNNDPSQFHYLSNAQQLAPHRKDLYDDFIGHYEVTNNPTAKAEYCQKMSAENVIPRYAMDYNYNVLASLEPNAILVTHGELDTYPVWVLQEVKKKRKDIIVVNMDLMNNLEYRQRILHDLGVEWPVNEPIRSAAFFSALANNKYNRPIALPLTFSPPILKELSDNLFVTGLVMNYANELEPASNLEKTQNLWEKGLKRKSVELAAKSTATEAKQLSMNYIPMLSLLHGHYRVGGEHEKAMEVYAIAKALAENAGKANYIDHFFIKE